MDTLIRWSLHNRALVLAAAMLLLVLGIFTVARMPVDVFPDLTAPTDPKRATVLLGAAEALAVATGHQMTPVDLDHRERVVALARSSLDDAALEAETRAGQLLALEDVIAVALATA